MCKLGLLLILTIPLLAMTKPIEPERIFGREYVRRRPRIVHWDALIAHARALTLARYGLDSSKFGHDITADGEIILVGAAQTCRYTPAHEAITEDGGFERIWKVAERLDCAERAD